MRQAESRRRGGHPEAAVQLLEEALEASLELRADLPGWLCGRLAALYRTLGRYDDEVHLLERYRDSQATEEARTRYDARLSKARTIAERKRRPASGALDSVRASMGRPAHRRTLVRSAPLPAPAFSSAATDALTRALSNLGPSGESTLHEALALVCAEAHAHDIPVEELVGSLRSAAAGLPSAKNGRPRDSRFDSALLLLLALYYEEQHT